MKAYIHHHGASVCQAVVSGTAAEPSMFVYETLNSTTAKAAAHGWISQSGYM
jgi:hypothetical protein